MLDERQIGDLMLTEIESAEQPSVVLNVERAMSTARRQRRLAQGAGAALLAVALTVGGLTVPDLLTPDRPPAPAPFGTAPADGQTGLPVALTTVDPQRVYVRFGWLPDGLPNLQYQAGLLLSGSGVYLSASTAPGGGQWKGVAITLYPKGVQPSAPQRDSGEAARPGETTPGPQLNGGASSFAPYSGAEQPEAILRWRYAPDGWAQLKVVGVGADVRSTATQVARALRFGDDPIPMPATVAGVPATLQVIAVDVQESLDEPKVWYASTTWSPKSISGDPGQQRARTMTVSISRYRNITDPADNEYVDPNTTVGGHPARFGGQNGFESLTVYDVNGANVTIDDSALLPTGGTRALFPAVTLVAEPANWHTHLHR
ncbi:hypothetical protein GAR06_06260 [Micromonospora saelicesensis]|uniref:hypothetical protein n=1 Tax=Micromonospora saelicesensis TaxID=285676 RepID=UPI000DC04163|nr:hypothetical protein [Micromonospora saelicesensis]RAO40514.1 hypothetical protein GAR06_06260 [Micromonospora saelicesensis]RAO41649.1 hypothetical protein PSN01_06442 [Micromonospora saelicesensis]RAO58495.1 hypothetical protein LUPAC06_02725 [Micromonospora saelicesensis]